jgi:haloalkane dehalogenase
MISEAFPYEKKCQQVLGLEMAYVELGSGDPIVFLHGNPTSSYLWRNILPYAQEHGRCIAPDLIGMGDSEKLPDSGPDSYTFVENRRYLDALLDQLGVNQRVILVVHDWGSALGFDWAKRNPDAVKGIVHMEAIVATMSWEDMPPPAQTRFRAVHSEEGEELVLQQNIFLEQSLFRGTLRPLTDAEMDEYRRPFLEPGEGRRPTLTWPRQLPIGGEPADVVEIVNAYAAWLSTSAFPKLYIRAEPGTHSEKMIEQVRTWPNQQEVTVRGVHYPQEDSPDEIGVALAAWLKDLE